MVSGAVFSIGVRDLLSRTRAGHQKKGRVKQLELIDLDLPVACRSVAGPRLCPLEIALLQSSLQMNLGVRASHVTISLALRGSRVYHRSSSFRVPNYLIVLISGPLWRIRASASCQLVFNISKLLCFSVSSIIRANRNASMQSIRCHGGSGRGS